MFFVLLVMLSRYLGYRSHGCEVRLYIVLLNRSINATWRRLLLPMWFETSSFTPFKG